MIVCGPDPLELLAAALRRRIAAGLPNSPRLLAVMDAMIPGWRSVN